MINITISQKERNMALQNRKRDFYLPVWIIMMGLLFHMMPGVSRAEDLRMDDQYVKTQRVEATIIKKRPDYIQTTQDKFVVYTATRVFLINPETGKEIKEITLAELAYPCRVFINYEVPLSNQFHARRIEVVKAATGARTQWTPEVPQ